MDEANKNVGIIVLAAGASSRMKQPKQLLEFEGKTLLRRAALTAIESVCNPVIVVLGANFEDTKKEIEDLPVEICFNENWQTGLSSSIKKGLEKLSETNSEISAAVLMLCDQPLIEVTAINKIFRHGKISNRRRIQKYNRSSRFVFQRIFR
jgi:molybdenum cofactor cytidylyltransferase